MADNVIISEIILRQGTSSQIAQACSGLNNNYYSANALANNLYTFEWGANGSLLEEIRLGVGNSEILLQYDSSTQQVVAFGTCGTTDFGDLSVNGRTVLHYSHNGFSFTAQFQLIDGERIEITVQPANNTAINAWS